MLTTRPNQAGRPERAAPHRLSVRLGLVAFSLVALLPQGCASWGGGCGNACGGGAFSGLRTVGSRIASCNIGQKLFHRRGVLAADSCGEPGLGVTTMEPGVVVTPGSVLGAPPAETDPNILPNTKDNSLNSPTGSGKASGTQSAISGSKPHYQSSVSRPRGEASTARREAPSSSASDALANLPALTTPAEAIVPAESSPPASPTGGERPAPEKPAVTASKPADITAGLGTGIRRFRGIEPRLSIGSLPSEAGWKWLTEHGYKTVIDLRQSSEIRPEDTAAINHQGLRYVAIPMPTDVIDTAAIAKLETELAREESRPTFVFDNEGTRPAAAGYLHLGTTRKLDSRTAELEVEELGATDTPLWKAAVQQFAKNKQAATQTSNQTPPSVTPENVNTPSAAEPAPGAISS